MIKEAYIDGYNYALEKLSEMSPSPTMEAPISATPKPMTTAAESLQKGTQINFNKSIAGSNKTFSSFNTPGVGTGRSIKPPTIKIKIPKLK